MVSFQAILLAAVASLSIGSGVDARDRRSEDDIRMRVDDRKPRGVRGPRPDDPPRDRGARGRRPLDPRRDRGARRTRRGRPDVKAYTTEPEGEPGSMDYRVFFKNGEKTISPWHDIPLSAGDNLYNFVCEIPKETDAKMECATDEPFNPIKQDTKEGALRFYPYNIHWNYGFLPQTWEDPAYENVAAGGVFGDNDPLDVVELSSAALATGGVYQVKCVGVYAMIDDGELDWKVIAISVADPLAEKINDVEDVERELPGELEKVKVWFRDYKIPAGNPPNTYGFDGECLNAEYTKGVIEESHGFYAALKSGERENDEELALE